MTSADYGWDDPRAPIGLAAGGAAALVFDAIGSSQRWGAGFTAYFGVLGVGALAGAVLYAYVTRLGKHVVWGELLNARTWRGDETVLDLGCGRGTVLIKAAGHVPNGHAVGVDIWDQHDQSGNRSEATLRNAELEGVAAQTQVQTADIRELPSRTGVSTWFSAVSSSTTSIPALSGAGSLQRQSGFFGRGGRSCWSTSCTSANTRPPSSKWA